MKTILLLCGLQGSGKSKWAKEQIQRHRGQYKRISKDSLRNMLDNDQFTLENEVFILNIRDKIVEKALRDGYSVLLDDTNFPTGGKHFLRMCEIAQLVGDVQVVEKYFDVSLKEALKRNSMRDIPVPDHIIEDSYKKHIKNKKFEIQNIYFPPVEEGNMMLTGKPKAVIFDIDGTLSIRGDRSYYDWDKVECDTINYQICYINTIIKYSDYIKTILVVSGRDQICEKETKDWLSRNGIEFTHLYMRPAGDIRRDVDIKEEIYNNYIKDNYDVISVFDDRNQTVELWRRLGLCCLQCSGKGDF